MPKQDLGSRADRAVRDMRKKEYKDTVAVADFIRHKAAGDGPIETTGDVNIDGEERRIDFKVLLKLLASGAVLVMLWFVFGPAHAKSPTDAEKREASYKCQRAAVARNGGLVLPAATCVCNAKAGLPEYPSCRAQRAQKGGR